MKPNLIVIDGKTYNSVNEMPPDVRAKYEGAMDSLKDGNQNGFPDQFENINILKDQNGNGIPNVFESASATQVTTSSTKFIVNGKEFNSLEDLPPDARAKYEQAMGSMDKNRNGVPDFAEDMLQKIQPTRSRSVSSPMPPRPSQPTNASPTVSPDTSNGWTLVLLVGLLLFICAAGAAGVWSFFLR